MLIKKRNKAFSIVEISISIAVISLILALLIQAHNHLQAKDDKKIIAEISKISQALSSFKIKYSFYPGDFPHASSYFSNLSANYDGNGNNRLDEIITASISEASIIPALLAETDLLTGFNIAADDQIISQATKQASWFFTCHRSCTAGLYNYDYADASFNLAKNSSFAPALTTTDSYNIDAKIDDSSAKSGKIMGFSVSESYSCTTGNDYTNSDDGNSYDLTESGLDCALAVNLEKIL